MNSTRRGGTQENRAYSLRPSLTRRVMIYCAASMIPCRASVRQGEMLLLGDEYPQMASVVTPAQWCQVANENGLGRFLGGIDDDFQT